MRHTSIHNRLRRHHGYGLHLRPTSAMLMPRILSSATLAGNTLAWLIPVEISSSATFRARASDWRTVHVNLSPWGSGRTSKATVGAHIQTNDRESRPIKSVTLHDRMAQVRKRCTRRATCRGPCTSTRTRRMTFEMVTRLRYFQ